MRLFYVSLLVLFAFCAAICRAGDEERGSSSSKSLVVYFSATGNTRAVAEAIAKQIGADIFRLEAAEPYHADPYIDSERVKKEAYGDLRPQVASLPDAAAVVT